ncbi:putative adenylyl-sulfate kinase [Caballeronia sp. SBC1]|uniref:adenylyl-sulfate kinase n=1 Tax=Caballeronia sp. SBC1 TaxID=2705548 RepID=UPI001407767D|nr:adenylyl-sulfate kinase [Caballeronia sp. SBC1]QIN62872.1 putative adenylyl-sulfate kinase [Caballeronia sp. SBC1]
METTHLTSTHEPSSPATNVVTQPSAVTREQRESRNDHRGAVVWLTGLPGSGKSTIARSAERILHDLGLQTVTLDGDNIRLGLCADLSFSAADRNENVRRVAETAKLFLDQGNVVIVALVSPVRQAREKIKEVIPAKDFLEVYCRCPLSICEQRDPKGHYARAKRGEISNFTGLSSFYEEPLEPALLLRTDAESAEESVRRLSELVLEQCKAVKVQG